MLDKNVRIFDQRERRRARLSAFLIFWSAGLRHPPIGDRGRKHRAIDRQRVLDRRQHLARGLDLHDRHARADPECRRAPRSGSPARRRRRPPPRWHGPACRTIDWRCSAPDRSARASVPTSPAAACRRARRAAAMGRGDLRAALSAAAAISSGSAMRPVPASPRSAISPSPGPTIAMPSAASCARLRRVAAWRPHMRVHGGRDQHRRVGRQQHRGGEIVGMAARHLGHQVGGRRRHHHEIGVARQAGCGRHRIRSRDRTDR